MKYLITGTNGFIGRSLLSELSKDKSNEIIAVDISLNSIPDAPNITKIPCDLLDSSLKELPDVDFVIHAAALLGVDYVEKHPVKTVLNNIGMFNPLVKYISDENTRFVFFSTSEVYGDGQKIDNDGSSTFEVNDHSASLGLPNLYDPRSSYPISKIVGEFISNLSNNSICLRPHNIYGPNMGDRHVMPQLISKISKADNGNSISIYNPNHIRSFCFIDDAIQQIIYWMHSDLEGPVNIGNSNEPVTIKDLFKALTQKMGKTLQIEEAKKHLTSPSFRKPKIESDLFEYTSLSDGLEIMIRAYSK